MRSTALILILLLLGAECSFAQRPRRRPRRPRPEAVAPAMQAKPEAEKKETEDGKEPKFVAIVGATLYPVSKPPISNGTIILKDDKIAQLGRDLTIPKGATVVKAHGKHVVPGFVAAFAASMLGGGRDRSTETDKAADRFNPFDSNMLLGLATGITTAHQAPGGRPGFFGRAGPAMRGSTNGSVGGLVAKLTYGTLEGYELRSPTGIYVNTPRSNRAMESLRTLIKSGQTFRKQQKEYVDLLIKKDKKAKEPKAKGNAKAMAQVLDGELALFVIANTRAELRRVLQISEEFDLPMIIEGAQEAWTIPSEIGRQRVSLVITPRGMGGRSARPYRDRNRSDPHGWSVENAALLSRAGVRWSVRTRSVGASVFTGLFGWDMLSLPWEAAFSCRAGVSDEEALASITLEAARMLRVSDRVGSLEVGKDADVLVMDREPMDYRSFVELAYVNGRVAYDKSKNSLYDHIQTDRSKGPKGSWVPWGPWPQLQAKTPPPSPANN